jgi:hypothetical protein
MSSKDRVALHFHSRLIPFILVDYSSMPGYTPGLVTGVGSNNTNSWHTRGICTPRGLFTPDMIWAVGALVMVLATAAFMTFSLP